MEMFTGDNIPSKSSTTSLNKETKEGDSLVGTPPRKPSASASSSPASLSSDSSSLLDPEQRQEILHDEFYPLFKRLYSKIDKNPEMLELIQSEIQQMIHNLQSPHSSSPQPSSNNKHEQRNQF